jgi:hypothetical protein
MKAGVRALRVVSTLWTVATFMLIGLMMIPVVPGAVQVDLPEPESWTTSITNETVTMTNNISLRNGGLFPFNDFLFILQLYGNNGSVLAQFNSTQVNLPTNTWVQIPLTFEISRSNIQDNQFRDILFDEVTVGGLIYFNVRYLFDFRAQLGVNGSIAMGPLIEEDFDIDHTVVTDVNGNSTILIPYSLNTSKVLYGRNINLSGTISNETQVLGTINQTILLGEKVEGNLTINLVPGAYDHLNTTSDHLILNVTVTIGDFTWSYQRDRDWQPPSGG